MAINEIEMNTSTLASDIETLEHTVKQLEDQMKKMFNSIKELDAMWDGPASAAFKQQFQLDYQTCKNQCNVLRELIKSLRYAKTKYDSCEQRIDGMIRSIRI